jgi:hypothetical protein
MITSILFVIYLILLLFLFYFAGRKLFPWMRFWQFSAIFFVRVFLGCLYGYIFLHFYGGDDTWNFFQDSIPEKAKLLHHPVEFLSDFLPRAAFAEAHSFWEGISFYLRNLEYWIIVKSLAVFNLLSLNNYYVDVIFFEFVTIWGPMLLLKMLDNYFPHKRSFLVVVIFFIPSISFWLCGIRAEAMILLAMAVIFFYTRAYRDNKNGLGLLFILAGFIGFIIFRVQYLAVFLPAYISWLVTFNRKRRTMAIYRWVYGLCLLVFLLSLWIWPGKNLATPMVHVQEKFMALHGNTRLPLDNLEATLPGFVKIFPQAFANSFLRPWITEAKGSLQVLSSLEIMGFWILCLIAIFSSAQDRKILGHPLIQLFMYYGLTQILIIGFLVPFPGAIIRYKSIPELLLVLSIGLSIHWKSLYRKKL